MARSKRAHWLDQAILEAKPGDTPKADFDAWRNAHAGAIRRLKQRGTNIPRNPFLSTATLRFVRNTWRSPLPKLAVAAAVIAGILLLVTSRMNREPTAIQSPTTAADHTARPQPEAVDPAERELRLAGELFRQNDVEGLLVLLRSDRSRTVFAVAAYLGQIGDLSAVPALQTLAAQWRDSAQENPFQRAIDQIRLRHGQSETAPSQDRTVVIPATTKPSPSGGAGETQTCRGVVQNKAGAPVADAKVWAQRCTKDLQLTDVTSPVHTDPQGRFSLVVLTGESEANSRIYLLCDHPKYALGWTRLPADGEDSDLDDCLIVLYEPTVVAGTVTGVRDGSVPGALVEARIVPEHDPTSEQEYPYTIGNQRAVKANSAGQFMLTNIPEGSLLSLSVSHVGYASYDSREGYGSLLGTSPYLDPESYTIRAGREDVQIELIRAWGVITGQVLDEHDRPYSGPIILRCEDSNRILAGLGYSYSDGRCVPMDVAPRGRRRSMVNHHFTINDLPVGEYVVAAVDPASGNPITPVVRAVISKAQRNADVTLRVGKTVDVRVRVRKQTGEPLAGALVTPGVMTHGYTESNGICVLPLVRSEHTIRAYAWACQSMEATIRESHGPASPPVDIVVESLPELRGRLVDEFGMPVQGWVRPWIRERVLTDAEGRFIAARKWESEMYLARNREGTLACICLGTISTRNPELQIRLEPVAVFTGRVLDHDGTPIDDAPVVFSLLAHTPAPLGWSHVGSLRCRVFLFDGRFRLEVPVGLRLTLAASSDGCQERFTSIVPVPGQTYDLGDIVLQLTTLPAP